MKITLQEHAGPSDFNPTQSTPDVPVEVVPVVMLRDDFADTRLAGTVAGTGATTGVPRKVIDCEGVIRIDNGALRIQPLIEPGWGRAGIAYGPFERRNGRSFAVFMLNCHNTSQSENLNESFRSRLDRWLRGPEVHGRGQRLLQWLSSKRRSRMWRQWRWWRRISASAPPVPRIDENLAVGWFSSEIPGDPLSEGNGLVMHATGAENGELWARVGNSMLPTVRGVQNLQIHYVVVLRECGAAYYASTVAGANGLGAYPNMRLLAIDAFNDEPSLNAGVHQATLGQIGFRLDTRIYGARIADIPEWSNWFGAAHAADRLNREGVLAGSTAEVGGSWHQLSGHFELTADGATATEDASMALLFAPAPSGLVHVVIDAGSREAQEVGLVWRHADANSYWLVSVGAAGCVLRLCMTGETTIVAYSNRTRLKPGCTHSLQVADEGHRFSIFLDGALLFEKRFVDDRLRMATGVGIYSLSPTSGVRFQRFEAHPLECRLPEALDKGEPWWQRGHQDVASDDFDGPPGDLDGKPTKTGGLTWRRIIGSGHIEVTGEGSAKVRSSVTQRCPGRLAYAIDWAHPEFADLEVEITPPGTGRGQGEHGRCGFILWQDSRNYLVLNNWLCDGYKGASISTFFFLDGFEDLYDAVWVNVGKRVEWGCSHRLRVAFDGMHYLAWVNDEPVLYRSLTDVYPDAMRLEIRRVGLLANWEWGTDTGSVFREFRARTRPRAVKLA